MIEKELYQWIEEQKAHKASLTPREKLVDLRAKVDILVYLSEFPCKCDRRKLPEYFAEVRRMEWEYLQQIKELEESL